MLGDEKLMGLENRAEDDDCDDGDDDDEWVGETRVGDKLELDGDIELDIGTGGVKNDET